MEEINIVEIDAKTGIITQSTEVVETPQVVINYEDEVVRLIRMKYTTDEEFKVNRERESNPQQFEEYYDYVEECKINARLLIAGD